MQELALNELKKNSYTEDRVSKRAFERRYRFFVIPGLLLGIGALPFARYVWWPFTDFFTQFFSLIVCFLIGLALCLGAATHANRSVPISRQSGAPMECFLRSDAPEETTEYLYVDHPSRTYFTRIVAVPGSGCS